MFRTYPLHPPTSAARPEGLRSIFRRLAQELEREPRTIRRPARTDVLLSAHA